MSTNVGWQESEWLAVKDRFIVAKGSFYKGAYPV